MASKYSSILLSSESTLNLRDPSLSSYYDMKEMGKEDFINTKMEEMGVDEPEIKQELAQIYDALTANSYEVLPTFSYDGVDGIMFRKDNNVYFLSDEYKDYLNEKRGTLDYQTDYSLKDILAEFDSHPPLIKSMGGLVRLEDTFQNYYDPYSNEITLSTTMLDNDKKGTSGSIGQTILHEHIHRLDFEQGKQQREGLISGHPYFRAISNSSPASAYSKSYKESDNPLDWQNYFGENLAESVMPMRYYANKSTRHMAMISDPDTGEDIPYGNWRKTHTELAEVAEKVYSSNSLDEIVSFLDKKWESYPQHLKDEYMDEYF